MKDEQRISDIIRKCFIQRFTCSHFCQATLCTASMLASSIDQPFSLPIYLSQRVAEITNWRQRNHAKNKSVSRHGQIKADPNPKHQCFNIDKNPDTPYFRLRCHRYPITPHPLFCFAVPLLSQSMLVRKLELKRTTCWLYNRDM